MIKFLSFYKNQIRRKSKVLFLGGGVQEPKTLILDPGLDYKDYGKMKETLN
jgi:hypothetical protein